MLEKWSFHNPVRIVMQDDIINSIDEQIPYQRIALLTTPGFVKRGVASQVEKCLGNRLIGVFDIVQPNPDIDNIDGQVGEVRSVCPDALVALGGGSAIDTAKAMARMVPDSSVTLGDHLRRNLPFSNSTALPIVAIPTTAGTGAEVTPFGTIWDRSSHKKYSIDGKGTLPKVALLDPTLTLGLPKDITVTTGLDAISHSLESIWNKGAGPISMGLATASLKLSLESLPALMMDLSNLEHRRSMLIASTMAGMAISQTRTALAHSMSYPITADFGVPHGLACGFALPEILWFNAQVDDGRLERLAKDLGMSGVDDLRNKLSNVLDVLRANELLSTYVKKSTSLLEIRSKMINKSRASNNLRDADEGTLEEIINKWIERSSRTK